MSNSTDHDHKDLPPEVVALVHHVELYRSGWRDVALQRLIQAMMWLSPPSSTLESIQQSLAMEVGVSLSLEVISDQLQKLADQDEIIQGLNGDFRLPESRKLQNEAALTEGENIASNAYEYFITLLANYCPDLDGLLTWDTFNDELLAPLINDLGARTYDFILGQPLDLQSQQLERSFLEQFDRSEAEGLRRVIVAFLDPTVTEVRAYVLRKLATFFLVRAVSLPAEAVQALNATAGTRPRFRVLLDTNFLFSCLGLHDNPSNDAASSLLALSGEHTDLVDLRFYVLSDTLDEARRALIGNIETLSSLRLRGSLSRAASEVTLSGLAQRFVQESLKPGGPTTAEEFFAPYVDNLLQVARSKGIDIYQIDTTPYHVRQDVVDDIEAQRAIEEERRPDSRRRPKSYEQIEHDMTLWHVAKDLRPKWVESALQAQFWIATVDFRFIGFDAYKTRSGIPLCVHPTTLIQLLQFWLPRDARLSDALVSGLRLPFLFLPFDVEAEHAVVKILETLGRFADSENLSVETVTHILMNQALRDRIAAAQSTEDEIELVRLELVEHDDALQQELQRLRTDRARLEGISAVEVARAARLDEALSNLTSEREEDRRVLEEMASQLQALEAEREERSRIERRRARMKSSLWVPLAVSTALLVALGILVCVVTKVRAIPLALIELGLWLIVAGETLLRFASKDEVLQSNRLLRHSRRMRAALWTVVAAVLGAALYGPFANEG